MKNTLCFRLAFVFIFFFLFNSVSKGQPTTWAQPGAHWIYNLGDGTTFGSTGVSEVRRAGDTIMNGISCDILTIHNMFLELWPGGQWQDCYLPNRYTYRSNDTVFVSNGSVFEILFITNAQPGSEWVTGPDIFNACIGDTLFVDSLQSVSISGVTMNKIIIQPIPGSWMDETINHHMPFFERFGSSYYILPLPSCITDIALGPLICYQDSGGFYYSQNPLISCPVGLEEIGPENNGMFTISPTLASEEITIIVNSKFQIYNEDIELTNVKGENIRTFQLNQYNQKLNLSGITAGMYWLKIKNRPQMKPVSFIKL